MKDNRKKPNKARIAPNDPPPADLPRLDFEHLTKSVEKQVHVAIPLVKGPVRLTDDKSVHVASPSVGRTGSSTNGPRSLKKQRQQHPAKNTGIPTGDDPPPDLPRRK